MSRLARDGTAEPVSRDQILRHARGQRNIHFPCSADHEQYWQPYPVDPYSAICDKNAYIHTYSLGSQLPRNCTQRHGQIQYLIKVHSVYSSVLIAAGIINILTDEPLQYDVAALGVFLPMKVRQSSQY